jgi:hypothetical protein
LKLRATRSRICLSPKRGRHQCGRHRNLDANEPPVGPRRLVRGRLDGSRPEVGPRAEARVRRPRPQRWSPRPGRRSSPSPVCCGPRTAGEPGHGASHTARSAPAAPRPCPAGTTASSTGGSREPSPSWMRADLDEARRPAKQRVRRPLRPGQGADVRPDGWRHNRDGRRRRHLVRTRPIVPGT